MIRHAAIALAFIFASTVADARPREARTCEFTNEGRKICRGGANRIQSHASQNRQASIVGGRPAGCPRRYCGCGVSLKVFGRIIPELNLAANWVRKFPRTRPAAGMVAARRGHVFYIKAYLGGNVALAYDPNSGGGKTRIHERSLAGYTVVDPHGNRMAGL